MQRYDIGDRPCAKSDGDEVADIAKENYNLRALLAFAYSGAGLYTDDGELQDGSSFTFIDFKRDSIEELREKMAEKAKEKIKKFTGGNP